jgi:hypothetical protein
MTFTITNSISVDTPIPNFKGFFSTSATYLIKENDQKTYKVTRLIFAKANRTTIYLYWRKGPINALAMAWERMDHKITNIKLAEFTRYRAVTSKVLVVPPKPVPAPVNPLLPKILVMQTQLTNLTNEVIRLNQALVKANGNIALLSKELAATQANLATTQAALAVLLK